MGVREACEQDDRVRGGETHDDRFEAFRGFCVEEEQERFDVFRKDLCAKARKL